MRIGINESILSAEHAPFYTSQLTKEGHEVVTTLDKFDDGVVFEMCVCDNLEKLVFLIGKVRHLLFFSSSMGTKITSRQIISVGSWGEIYDYIRYEI